MDVDIPCTIQTELQKAREEEKRMNGLKQSFEKQLQNERTLKIQVCLHAYTGLQSLESLLYFLTFIFLHRLVISDSLSFVVKNIVQLHFC